MTKLIHAALALPITLVLAGTDISVGQEAGPATERARAELTAREALGVVTDSSSDYSAVADRLVILRTIVEGRAGASLSPETRTRIRDAARQRLTGDQHYAVVTRAIDLASAMDDSLTLERIGGNASEVEALGFTEPEMVEWIQLKARNGLDGAPSRR